MPRFNPERLNIKDLTIEEPEEPERIPVYSLGAHDASGGLSWTTDHAEAKRKWDAFWSRSVANQKRRAELKASEYQQLYSLLTGYGVGPARPKDASDGLDGFDDEGVGYKDEVKRKPAGYPPMPMQRNL